MILGKTGWRTVPPIADRVYVLEQYHDLAHVHADKMYLSLKKWFFWGGMRADCLEYCRSCDACKGESARFLRHSSLTPNDKGESPL